MPDRKPSSSTVLAAVILSLSLFLMSLSIEQGNQIKGIREKTYALFEPPSHLFTQTGKSIYKISHYLITMKKLVLENKKLKEEIEKLKMENLALKEEQIENKRLRKLLKFKRKLGYRTIAASIIAWYPPYFSQNIVVNKGYLDGIKSGMAVATYRGLVGKIDKVFSKSSTILLLTDRKFSIGAIIQRTRNEGVLSGGKGGYCYLQYLPCSANIKPGDIVMTIGFGSLLPKGMIIGKVVKIKRKSLFTTAIVKPATDFSRLEEVLIITGRR